MEKIRLVDEGRVPRFFCNLLKHSIQIFYNGFKHVHGTDGLKTRPIKKKMLEIPARKGKQRAD